MDTEIYVEERVARVVLEHLDMREEPVQTDILTELGADSLDRVELIMLLEGTFSIKIPDEEIFPAKTVADLVELVKKYKK